MIPARQRRCALVAFLALALPLWLVGCGTNRAAVDATVAENESTSAPPITMYVVRRGWHIDVGFAATDLTGPLKAVSEQFPEARFFTFGFGDRRYLHAHNPALPNLLAALWPGDGLLLVTALRQTPQQAFGDGQVVELRLTAPKTADAQRRMTASLSLQDGRPQSDGPGPYEGSVYWRSSLRYSATYTCNTWAAQVLESAGLPLQVHGIVFAGQVWRPVLHLAGSPGQGARDGRAPRPQGNSE
jgi:hypothetical protein